MLRWARVGASGGARRGWIGGHPHLSGERPLAAGEEAGRRDYPRRAQTRSPRNAVVRPTTPAGERPLVARFSDALGRVAKPKLCDTRPVGMIRQGVSAF